MRLGAGASPVTRMRDAGALHRAGVRLPAALRRSGSIGVALAACAAAALAQPAPASDLLDAYAQARAGDPVLASAGATRRAVQENVDQARAPLLPQVSAAAGLRQYRDDSGFSTGIPGTSRERDASATLSQVVVDLGQLGRLRVAESQADAQDWLYRAESQALCVRVAGAYFGVLVAADALEYAEANEAAFAQQVAQADERYRAGLSAAVDLDQARAYRAQAEAGTIAARQSLADAREALTEITGTPTPALKTLRDDLPLGPPQPADAEAWVAASLRDNPLVAAQRQTLEAAERAIGVARAGHYPTLVAGVDVAHTTAWPRPDASFVDSRTVTTVGLALNIPIFSGGAVQSRLRQTFAQRDAAGDDLERQRRSVVRETLERYRSVVSNLGQLEAARTAVGAARKALASTRVGLELGTQTMTDLLLAIQTLTSAESTYSQSRHQYVLGRLLLQQSAGSVGESDLALVNALLE